jgi:hypothetical protein
MTGGPVSPEERYATLADTLLASPEVGLSEKRGFGSSALWTNGKIFVMLVRGELVVKLPRQRVDALILAGKGRRFDPGHGRAMQEWFTIEPGYEEEWLPLAGEALDFVASRR